MMDWHQPPNRRAHCIGIGGVGMTALALLLGEMGWKISGSDINDFRMRKSLQEKDFQVDLFHHEKLVEDATVVIYSSAIPADHPELLYARKKGIKTFERMEAIEEILDQKKLIGVTGSYGKSTTTTFVASMMQQSGLDPSWLVGADLLHFSPASYTSSSYLVLECDESKPKFLSLTPHVLVITNVGRDHLQEYNDSMDQLAQAFQDLSKRVPRNGCVIINGDDPFLSSIKQANSHIKFISCGRNNLSDYWFSDIKTIWRSSSFATSFRLNGPAGFMGETHLLMPGWQNVLDAVMAYAAALYLCEKDFLDLALFHHLPQMDRRMEFKASYKQCLVFDDEGDSPDVIKWALQGIGQYFPSKRRLAVIQPHRYSRLNNLFDSYAEVLVREADDVILLPVYGAGEKNLYHMDSAILAKRIISLGFKGFVYTAQNHEDAVVQSKKFFDTNTVLVTLGPGDVWRVADDLRTAIESLC